MRAIMVMFDTLTRKYLSAYGCESVITPNFKRLEDTCVVFDSFYGGSMPCMPARRDLHTGKYNFLHRDWGPLEPFDYSVIEGLRKEGVYTHLVTDHSHYFEDGGATYHNRYDTWEGFRGQEGDRWVPRIGLEPAKCHNALAKKGISADQHRANKSRIQTEEEMPSVRTVQAGLDFLKTNHACDNWFLQIECFDPHEPFDVPEKYRALYTDRKDEIFNWPAYGFVDEEKCQESIAAIRKEYAALITMCDRQLGRILDFMDEKNMWEDTLLIVNTDHGFLLGEHGFMGKNMPPMYDEVIHIPFFIHDPRNSCTGRRKALAQNIDVAPTLLEFFNIPIPENMDGKSLTPVIENDEIIHEDILFGIHGGHVNITDGRYLYMRASVREDNEPLVSETLMPAKMRGFIETDALNKMELIAGDRFTNQMPCLKIPVKTYVNSYRFGHMLFDIQKDPQQSNRLEDHEIETEMIERMAKKMLEMEAPEEAFERIGIEKCLKR